MEPSFVEMPDYDAYDPEDSSAPDQVYVNGLHLLWAGDRVFLADETSHTHMVHELQQMGVDTGDLVAWPLDRAEAAAFARYVDWDSVCDAFPLEHPIHFMPIPELPTTELDVSDPRVSQFDPASIRVALSAKVDQARARGGRWSSGAPEIPDEDMPPLD